MASFAPPGFENPNHDDSRQSTSACCCLVKFLIGNPCAVFYRIQNSPPSTSLLILPLLQGCEGGDTWEHELANLSSNSNCRLQPMCPWANLLLSPESPLIPSLQKLKREKNPSALRIHRMHAALQLQSRVEWVLSKGDQCRPDSC